MNQIVEIFSQTFDNWHIVLPMEAVDKRQSGLIQDAGWTIHYLFGANERGEYLDYYATHRMTNDRHIRIYASGIVETLESPQDFMIFPDGITKEEEKEIDKKYTENNRRIYDELARKGFV